MAHSTRVSIIHADGSVGYSTLRQVAKLAGQGLVVKITSRRYAVVGADVRAWRGAPSGPNRVQVMQLLPGVPR